MHMTLLLLVIPTEDRGKHIAVFDNFFSSLKLLDAMSQMSYFGVGTARENRIHSNLPMTKTLKKMDRGTTFYTFD